MGEGLEQGAAGHAAGPMLGELAEPHQGDQGAAEVARVAKHEGQEAQLAEAVAAVAGDHVGQVVHVAHAVAEQNGGRADGAQAPGFRGLDQPVGGKVFALHENQVGPPEAAVGQGGQAGPVLQAVEQLAALQHDRGAHGRGEETVEHAPARPAAQRGHDHEHLAGVLRVAKKAASGAQGGERAERRLDRGGFGHDRLLLGLDAPWRGVLWLLSTILSISIYKVVDKIVRPVP